MAEDQTGKDVEPPQNAAERSGSSSESRQKAEGRRHDLPVPRVAPRDGRAQIIAALIARSAELRQNDAELLRKS